MKDCRENIALTVLPQSVDIEKNESRITARNNNMNRALSGANAGFMKAQGRGLGMFAREKVLRDGGCSGQEGISKEKTTRLECVGH